ncbi:LamG-like jellyroll fold domain-containing protein [Clostridium sp. LP20]|uniref:LamG-like jellyroll fold domain-containing protein n=1 Tax=Clostridium sp. LP20 TaxID=3418665 RepID=UPI003EE6313C
MRVKMKSMKKVMALLLTATSIITTSSTMIVKADTIKSTAEVGETKQEAVSFGVVSDTHVGPSKTTENERLKNAFQFYSNKNVNTVAVVGDLTDGGSQKEYDEWKKIKDWNLRVPLVASMGNHEGNTATGFLGATGNKPNDNKVINGYHFITLSPGSGILNESTGKGFTQGGGNYTYAVPWLKKQLDAAVAEDPTKPIFIFFHHPIKNTFYVSNEWYGSGLEEVFKKYPQAVTFSGHIHTPNNMPTSIWQDGGYTAVNTATLSYMEMETGMIYGSIPPDGNQIAQGMLIEAKGSEVTIKNYDFLSGSWIPQTWTFDITKKLPYTNERAAKTEPPVFDASAKVSVSNITEDSAKITFDQAKVVENTVGDIVHSYRYDFINKKTGKVDRSFKTWSEYYLQPMPSTISQVADNLNPGTEYEVRLYPINAYNKVSSKYISNTFKTIGKEDSEVTFDDMREELPKADLLDVDFEGGKIKDNSIQKHTFRGSNGSNITEDNILNKNVATFTGKNSEAFLTDWTTEQYAKTNDGLTMETVFKVDKFNTSSINFLGNTESAGISFEIYPNSEDSNKADLSIWAHLGSYKIARANGVLKYGEWNHTAITYDGSKLNLYLNGEKIASIPGSGLITTPNPASRYYVIGADTGANDSVQSPFVGAMATARIYSEPLSAKKIKLLANRELTSLDKTKPEIKVSAAPSLKGNIGEGYEIPSAQSADNSTVVKMKATVLDSNNEVVLETEGNLADVEKTIFTPMTSGNYKLVYVAIDKGGNETALSYEFTISPADKIVDGGTTNTVNTLVNKGNSLNTAGTKNNSVKVTSSKNKVKTGDTKNSAVPVALMGISLLGGGIVVGKKKRKDYM